MRRRRPGTRLPHVRPVKVALVCGVVVVRRRTTIDVVVGDPDIVRRGRPGDPDVRPDADVTFRLPGCDGATWSPVGGGGVVVLATVAVIVFLASTVPEPLTARTSNVWLPFATDVDAQKLESSPNGTSSSVRTRLPSTRHSTFPGVVLDLVAVTVVDGTPADDTRNRRAVRDRLGDRARSCCGGRWWGGGVGADGGGDGVAGEQGAGVAEGAHLEGVLAVAGAGRPGAKLSPNGTLAR